MKITKYTHACVLVEIDGHAALFDPGVYSNPDVTALQALDAIFITHGHNDHMDVNLIKQIQARFPKLSIYAPEDAVEMLTAAGVINVTSKSPAIARYFDAPHESIRPISDAAIGMENGIHYLEKFSHPGDSHHFTETMPVLALPINGGPWGAPVGAVKVALEVKPKFILPIHDWHWHDEARTQMYNWLESRFAQEGITFLKPIDGQPLEIDV